MTTDQDLGSKLRRLGEAVAPRDGFAGRVEAAVASAHRPSARRAWTIPMRAAIAAGLLIAVPSLVFLLPGGSGPGGALPPKGSEQVAKPGGGAKATPPIAVAFALTDIAYINSKWGFIDRAGKTIIPAKYSRVGEFSEGLAPIKTGGTYFQGGQWGYVDRTGQEVIAPRFDWAWPFREGLAAVKVGDSYGFIDRAGKVVIPAKFEQVGRFSCGLTAVCVGGKWGFIGTDGKYRIEPQFADAGEFSEGLAPARPLAEPGKESKYGYIDAGGWYVIEPRFDYGRPFREGLAAVRVGEKWGFLGRTGQIAVEPRYDRVGDFHTGRARVHDRREVRVGKHTVQRVERSGHVDAEGNEVGPLRPDYDNGVAIDPKTGKLSARMIGEDGIERDVTDVDFTRLRDQGGLYRVWAPHSAGRMTYHTSGFVDRAGRAVIPPALEDVKDFHEGLAAFATGLDWKAVEATLKHRGGR